VEQRRSASPASRGDQAGARRRCAIFRRACRKRLEGVASLDGEEIRKQLREEITFECAEELRALRKEYARAFGQDLVQEGKRILVATMQRLAASRTTTSPPRSSTAEREIEGPLIGREGATSNRRGRDRHDAC